MRIRKQQGFTLIELLVVIAIIGMLASVVAAATNSARDKARDANRIANVKNIMTALEFYYEDNGQYPRSSGASSPNSGWDNSNDSSWNNLTTDLAPYLALPDDPTNTPSGWARQAGVHTFNFYSRGYGCNQQWYMIVYALENPGTVTSPGVQTCDGRTFNYGGSGTIIIGSSGLQN